MENCNIFSYFYIFLNFSFKKINIYLLNLLFIISIFLFLIFLCLKCTYIKKRFQYYKIKNHLNISFIVQRKIHN